MVEKGINSLSDVNNINSFEGELLDYNPSGGLVQIEEGLEHFIPVGYRAIGGGNGGVNPGGFDPPNDEQPGSGSGSGSGEENYNQIAGNMPLCSPTKPWLANLFGTTRVCIDKYASKQRVKTKFYSVNLYLAYAVGIKVKHQTKGWTGIWRKQDTDKVVLGVNSLTWKFNHSADFRNFGSPTDKVTRYYTKDGRLYTSWANQYPTYVGSANAPKLPFENKVDIIIEIAIDNLIFSDETQVRNFFYSTLWNTAKTLMQNEYNKNLKKAGVVIVTPTALWTQFYDFSYDCTNCAKREHVLDWGIATPVINYTFGSIGQSGSFSYSYTADFRNPSLIGMSSFGLAKRNNQWHGNRFQF